MALRSMERSAWTGNGPAGTAAFTRLRAHGREDTLPRRGLPLPGEQLMTPRDPLHRPPRPRRRMTPRPMNALECVRSDPGAAAVYLVSGAFVPCSATSFQTPPFFTHVAV
jgi:hypothetical protein